MSSIRMVVRFNTMTNCQVEYFKHIENVFYLWFFNLTPPLISTRTKKKNFESNFIKLQRIMPTIILDIGQNKIAIPIATIQNIAVLD